MKLITYILIAVTICTIAKGETIHTSQDGIDVRITVSPTNIVVGDPVDLLINASTNLGTTLVLENETAFESFTIVDQRHLLDIPTKNGREWTWSMKLDTFDASTTSLSGIVINWSKTDGERGSIVIDPIPIEIKSVAGDSLNDMTLRDIKGAVPLFTKSWLLVIVSVVVTLGVVVSLAFRLVKKNKPILTPYEKAIRDIAKLKESNSDVQSFYTTLSDIVRHYLEGRFHISATGQTTREFLIAAKQNPHLEHSDRESLGSFLVAADLVKFARHEPSGKAMADAIQQAEIFVNETVQESSQDKVEVAA